ncbi:glycosyltransferase family 8 protein [Ancylobacter sp. G4_0304]|uniref:glycosyltransferase family 8 protein n=1 Tax=Ancylobacter sp. G4_0304 TaxID=3114289 RepID=UPI0039C5C860
MIVATATDSTYVEFTAVMLASLAAHADGEVSAAYVFCDGVSEDEKAKMAASYGRPDLVFVDLTDDMTRHFGGRPVNHHLSRTAYARILMPLSLSNETGRLLYLDCDTLVNGSLSPLASLDMQGFPVAAVNDIAHRVPERHAKRNRDIGLPEDMAYFNSGVLLIDLEAWRRDKVSERTIAFALEHPELPMMDQDALNGALRGQWLALDDSWNVHRRLKKGRYDDEPLDWSAVRIIHFIGQVKPNYADCGHPARDIYLRYRARTPFGGEKLKTRWDRKIEKRVRKLRRFLGGMKRRLGLAAG